MVINITPPTVVDNCDGAPTISGVGTLPDTSTFNLGATAADYEFDVGTTTIVWSGLDAEGNTGTCIQTVTITTPPTTTVPTVVGLPQATAESNIWRRT